MKRKSIKFAAMTLHEANQRLLSALSGIYEKREAANIADWVMENVTGMQKADRLIRRYYPAPADQLKALESYTEELKTCKPVQYVLQEAWFYGMKFFVDERVLIPRPETEELVGMIIKLGRERPRILDIGTGSGCIAIALKKNLPDAELYACDISEAALAVAQKNASLHQADISFINLDFTDRDAWRQLPGVDILAGNPPYIPLSEKQSMHRNVTHYEPHTALFVPDEDPLLFYKCIAGFAVEKLLPGGMVFVETHERLAHETATVFADKGFRATIYKDMQGKERIITAMFS
ncbi:MAG TPA: peptide chain release factor N(5)-glutamine methyltransferase [Flavitalea sp.]|nr:peptide chain release factor N(5)-glutamine methyltransferase [Flavitalea sp.]